MKDCKKIHPLLPLYSEQQLSPGESKKVEKHLGLCADARKVLEQLGGLVKALHQIPEPSVPADLHEKIMAKLGHNVTPLPKHHGFWGVPAWAISAAAVLLFILLNQHPHWQDTLRVNQPPQEGDQTAELAATSPDRSTSPVSVFKKSAAAPRLQGADSNVDANFQLQKALPNAKPTGDGKDMDLEKEEDKNTGVGYSTNAAVPQAMKQGAAAGAVEDSSEKSAVPRTRKVRENTIAPAEAPSEPAPLTVPTPTPESLDRSLQSLTYSREESVTTWKGNNGPSTVESQELIKDAETFQKYWNIPHPGEAPPTVDFTTQAVVVLTAGSKPTAGYSIYVSRLEEKADQLVIHYRVDSPSADAATAQIFTNPWALQIIPKPSHPVIFLRDN